MSPSKTFVIGAALLLRGATHAAHGQTPAADPTTRLKQVLPAAVATRVIATIAAARTHDLPADALENRALKFAAKGVSPDAIERSIAEQSERMERVRDTLQRARGRRPSGDEIEAGAEAVRKGIDAGALGTFVRQSPADRSLVVPLYVIGSLLDRGLPSATALSRVEESLKRRVSDRDLEHLADEGTAVSGAEHGNRPAETGRALGNTKHPGSGAGAGQSGSAGGPPPGVPANGGKSATPPGQAKKPNGPPGKKP